MHKSSPQVIHIQNATENNLDHVTVDFPKGQFTVVTGPSGSGKSTLAFDTLYMESRRRYLDTLSIYARQFVGSIRRPTVESVTGITPAIAVTQGTSSSSVRSTVGTVTEIYDFIRLLWGRAGVQMCPHCGIEAAAASESAIVSRVLHWPEGTRAILYAPIVQNRKGMHEDVLKKLKSAGFVRVRIDGKLCDLSAIGPLAKTVRHTIDLCVDKIVIRQSAEARIRESIQTALHYGLGQCIVERLIADGPPQTMIFSEKSTCPRCGMSFPELNPAMLAFNSHLGECTQCSGTGMVSHIEIQQIIGDPGAPFLGTDGRNAGFLPYLSVKDKIQDKLRQKIEKVLKAHGLHPTSCWNDVTPENRGDIADHFKKILTELIHSDLEGADELSSASMTDSPCPECGGSRLNLYARHVSFCGVCLSDIQLMTIDEAVNFFEHVTTGDLDATASRIVEDLMPSLLERLHFVQRVGLGYLQLSRGASTLSGGEAQRIRLAGLLGNGLTSVTYVLDEPSIGLHARDQARLIGVLQSLRDRGNTVVVIEHDDATMRSCDYLIDVGPHAGRHGGHIIFAGPRSALSQAHGSLTADYLLGRKSIAIPSVRRPTDKGFITIRGAHKNNLKSIDAAIPLGCIVCITGVSGSGKSTLINEILLPSVTQYLRTGVTAHSGCDQIEGLDQIERILEVDQKPIGRTPRSNPATYTKVFDLIRQLFAAIPEAKMYGYTASRFSFNVSQAKHGGRCETCSGAGVRTIEMKFLSDTYVECEDCRGKRFNEATLRVRYLGRSIAEVLDMSFEDALKLFEGQSKIEKILRAVCDVGLGYLKLGQPSPTLSGGEAQRMKLASEIAKTTRTKTLFIFDEPSTGLHADDVRQLILVLNRLADMGHTVLIIEHNLDIIKSSDYLIDIGPEPGADGGRITALGTPEAVSQCEASHTGQYLKTLLR